MQSARLPQAPEPDRPVGLDRATYQAHLPLVRRVALRTAQTLPAGLSYDDIVRAGFSGLVAALHVRPQADDPEFDNYAAYRVRLAVLEFLKTQDPAARKLRGASLRVSEAMGTLTERLGRVPDEQEVADELGLDLAGYGVLMERIAEAGWVRLELTTPEGDRSMTAMTPSSGRIEGIIRALPSQYQVVLGLFYQEQCDLMEIGDVLGITRERACQLHAQAVHLIRGQLSRGGIV